MKTVVLRQGDLCLFNFNPDMPGLYWSYFSPVLERSTQALRTINVEIDDIAALLENVYSDIVCLPVGWNDRESKAYRRLKEDFRDLADPCFLENAASSALLLYPESK